MFSLFIRNYIGTLLGMIFFIVMFFSNIDMVFQTESFIMNLGIPHFVGWFLPLILFLYLSIFFGFQNRLLFGCKHAQRGLKHLFLIVSILYLFGLIGLIGFYFYGFDFAVYWMFFFGIFAIKNFYYFRKIQAKEYFEKIHKKLYLKYLSVYGIIIVVILGLYARPLSDMKIPQDYFKVNVQKDFVTEANLIVLLKDIESTQYLRKISSKSDMNADYDIIIYNFPQSTLDEINKVYIESEHFPELFSTLNYSYQKVIEAQKINLLKFEYEMLHENRNDALATLKNILKINKSIKNVNHNMIDYLTYIKLQSTTVHVLDKYFTEFSKEKQAIISVELPDINIDKEWKKALELEFSYKLGNLSYFYNIPLLLDKSEMFQVYLYTEFLKSENKLDDNIVFKDITRKNYLGLYLIEGPISNFDTEYKKLKELSEKIKEFKNTLN